MAFRLRGLTLAQPSPVKIPIDVHGNPRELRLLPSMQARCREVLTLSVHPYTIR
jgi:hypothetical protein